MELSGDGPLPVMHFGMNGMLMVCRSYRVLSFTNLPNHALKAQRPRAGLVYAETQEETREQECLASIESTSCFLRSYGKLNPGASSMSNSY